jgi:hypothetical protein
LRPITHDASQAMAYDERYTPLLKRAKLATVAQLCQRGLPPLNPTALTTMIDRWRPETHSFHLTCGELSITLQDQAMIFGLSIRGFAVTGNVVSDGWEARVTAFLGRPLPDLEPGKKRRTSGVPLRWLRAQFAPRLLPTTAMLGCCTCLVRSSFLTGPVTRRRGCTSIVYSTGMTLATGVGVRLCLRTYTVSCARHVCVPEALTR